MYVCVCGLTETLCYIRSVLIYDSLYRLETINNLDLSRSGVDDRFAYAHKIAIDLFQFMSSFAQEPRRSDTMIVPTNILDRWFERFERKYRMDPNFMMKSSI